MTKVRKLREALKGDCEKGERNITPVKNIRFFEEDKGLPLHPKGVLKCDLNRMATPRVNKGFLPLYVDQVVRLVCRISAVQGGQVEVIASDGGKINVAVLQQNVGTYAPQQIVEFIGKVRADLSLEEFNSTPFSENFDFDNFEQLVQLTHQHTDVFGTSAVH